MKNRILCIVGGTCTGKSTLLDKITSDNEFMEKNNLKKLVYSTTRKKRDDEIDGVDYHFKTNDEFVEDRNNHDIIEVRNYETKAEGMVEFYTQKSSIQKGSNYICTASPMQAAAYICNLGDDFDIELFMLHTDEIERVTRGIKRICNNIISTDDKNKAVVDICRRIIDESEENEDFAEFCDDEFTKENYIFYMEKRENNNEQDLLRNTIDIKNRIKAIKIAQDVENIDRQQVYKFTS